MILKRNTGFTLVEVLVATGILGILLMSYLMYWNQNLKTIKIVSDKSSLAGVLTLIEKDIMELMPFIPPKPENTIPDPYSAKSTLFDSTDKSLVGERCYDFFGGYVGNCADYGPNHAANYRVRFFKRRGLDKSITPVGAATQTIPISLVQFRVEYKIAGKEQNPFYFTRVMTEVMRY